MSLFFDTRTANEERGWFPCPCGYTLLLDILPGSLLLFTLLARLSRSCPRDSHSKSLTLKSQLMLVIWHASGPASLRSQDFTNIPSFPGPPKFLWPPYPGSPSSTECNRSYCRRLSIGQWSPRLSSLRAGVMHPQGPGHCLAQQEVFCVGSFTVWKS